MSAEALTQSQVHNIHAYEAEAEQRYLALLAQRATNNENEEA